MTTATRQVGQSTIPSPTTLSLHYEIDNMETISFHLTISINGEPACAREEPAGYCLSSTVHNVDRGFMKDE